MANGSEAAVLSKVWQFNDRRGFIPQRSHLTAMVGGAQRNPHSLKPSWTSLANCKPPTQQTRPVSSFVFCSIQLLTTPCITMLLPPLDQSRMPTLLAHIFLLQGHHPSPPVKALGQSSGVRDVAMTFGCAFGRSPKASCTMVCISAVTT